MWDLHLQSACELHTWHCTWWRFGLDPCGLCVVIISRNMWSVCVPSELPLALTSTWDFLLNDCLCFLNSNFQCKFFVSRTHLKKKRWSFICENVKKVKWKANVFVLVLQVNEETVERLVLQYPHIVFSTVMQDCKRTLERAYQMGWSPNTSTAS